MEHPKRAMTLAGYLDGMRAAGTAEELEAAIQAPYDHGHHGRTRATIRRVRIEAGERVCASHPHGRFVPRRGPRQRLALCGETHREGRHGTAWIDAGAWAKEILMREGFSQTAAHAIWQGSSDYPHRCLGTIEAALAGKLPDPELDVLERHDRTGYGKPIRLSVEQNAREGKSGRASRRCPSCGGTLFDWGAGSSAGFEFIDWHCNGCPDVFTEYMKRDRLYDLRQNPRFVADVPDGPRPAEAAPRAENAGAR